MEDGLERNRHSLNSYNDIYFETPDEKPIKTLYLCSPAASNNFELDKCVITDKKEKMQELVNNNYNCFELYSFHRIWFFIPRTI